jgi:hypothetical protein
MIVEIDPLCCLLWTAFGALYDDCATQYELGCYSYCLACHRSTNHRAARRIHGSISLSQGKQASPCRSLSMMISFVRSALLLLNF